MILPGRGKCLMFPLTLLVGGRKDMRLLKPRVTCTWKLSSGTGVGGWPSVSGQTEVRLVNDR